jgi:hypothetical protein
LVFAVAPTIDSGSLYFFVNNAVTVPKLAFPLINFRENKWILRFLAELNSFSC